MKVCVCFCQRTLNALLGLRNPYKERLCTIKKIGGHGQKRSNAMQYQGTRMPTLASC